MEHNDQALRHAAGQYQESHQAKLPSNFTYLAMQRIQQEERKRERRSRLVAIFSMAAVTVAGILVVTVLFGSQIIDSMQRAFQPLANADSSPAITVPLLLCLPFLAILDHILHKKFGRM